MTEWHRAWQNERTDLECIEVVRGHHRADAINADGVVIEFQHSSISPAKVAEREAFWGRGVWVVDGTDRDSENRISVRRKPTQASDDPWRSYRWPRSPSVLFRAKWPCWIDIGDNGLLQVWGAEAGRGNGWLVSKRWFIDEVVNGTRSVLRRHDPKRTEARIGKAKLAGEARDVAETRLVSLVQDCTRPFAIDRIAIQLPSDEPDPVVPVRLEVRPRDPPSRVTAGVCVYDHCSRQARLYPGGWRCDWHKPMRRAT